MNRDDERRGRRQAEVRQKPPRRHLLQLAPRAQAFAGMLEASRGYDWPPAPEGGGGGGGGPALVPATFSLHTGFELPEGGAPADAPERESIEVRLVAFFEEGPER